MRESLTCPVPEKTQINSLGSFRERTAQKLILHPENAPNILDDAEEDVRAYYSPVLQANPVFGEYKVDRTLRSIVFSAALFNGATFVMNMLGPDLKAHNERVGVKEPFDATAYFSPLDDLQMFRLQTPQCQEFVKGIGGVFMDVYEVGLLDPAIENLPLANQARELHKRFVSSQYAAGKGNASDDLEEFAVFGAEDNAHAVLHSLIGLGGVQRYSIDCDQIPVDVFGFAAISEREKLAGFASVKRSFAQEKIRPERYQPEDYRADDVIAFEQALMLGEPMPHDAVQTYFVRDDEGNFVSPYKSLSLGSWREPGMCAGFQKFRAPGDENSGNILFFDQTDDRFGVERTVYVGNNSLPRRPSRTSTVEFGINVGVLTAEQTIYPVFPKVA